MVSSRNLHSGSPWQSATGLITSTHSNHGGKTSEESKVKHLLITTIAAVLVLGCASRMQPPVTSIHKAAKTGNIRAVKQHLTAGVDVNAMDANKMTALHWAAMKGQKKVVELLIIKGANLNAKTSKNLTPLNLADNNFQNEIAELLITNGASEFVY